MAQKAQGTGQDRDGDRTRQNQDRDGRGRQQEQRIEQTRRDIMGEDDNGGGDQPR